MWGHWQTDWVGRSSMRPKWIMVNGVGLFNLKIFRGGQTDRWLSEFKVLIKYISPQQEWYPGSRLFNFSLFPLRLDAKEQRAIFLSVPRLTPELWRVPHPMTCVCVSVWMKCEVWPGTRSADRGHSLRVTSLAWLGFDSRPVCIVSCQVLHIYKAVLLLVKQSGPGICIVVLLLLSFTRPVPRPSHVSTSQHLDQFVFGSYFRLTSHLPLVWW